MQNLIFFNSQRKLNANNVRINALNTYIMGKVMRRIMGDDLHEESMRIIESERVKAIDSLTEKERSVVVLYYYEEMTLKEISLTLEVSESRVSQLHTKALNKMKKLLGDYVFTL